MKFSALVLASTAAVVVFAQDLPQCELKVFRPFLTDKLLATCGTETGYVFKTFAALNETIIQKFCSTDSCRTALEPFVNIDYNECIAPIGTKDKKLVADFVNPIKTACFSSTSPTPVPTTPTPTTPTPTTPTPTPTPTTPTPTTPAPTTKRPSC